MLTQCAVNNKDIGRVRCVPSEHIIDKKTQVRGWRSGGTLCANFSFICSQNVPAEREDHSRYHVTHKMSPWDNGTWTRIAWSRSKINSTCLRNALLLIKKQALIRCVPSAHIIDKKNTGNGVAFRRNALC